MSIDMNQKLPVEQKQLGVDTSHGTGLNISATFIDNSHSTCQTRLTICTNFIDNSQGTVDAA